MSAHVVITIMLGVGLGWCMWALGVIVREEMRARRAGERAEVVLNREFWDDRWDEVDSMDPSVKERLNRALDGE